MAELILSGHHPFKEVGWHKGPVLVQECHKGTVNCAWTTLREDSMCLILRQIPMLVMAHLQHTWLGLCPQ